MIIEGLSAQELQGQVFGVIKDRLCDAISLIPEDNLLSLVMFKKLLDNITDAVGILNRHGLLTKLDVSQPIVPLCNQGAALLASQGSPVDGDVFAARRVFTTAAALIKAVVESSPKTPERSSRLIEAAMAFGGAEVVLTHAVSGIWGVMADAATNAEIAEQIAKVRSEGGKKRAKALSAKADAWKTKALAFAIKRDAQLRNATRDRLALEIKFQFDDDVPGHRAIADWLEKEAEQPHGPLRSRARKKSA